MNNFKKQFPIFTQTMNDKPLVYLDSAATTQKPQVVIDAVSNFYTEYNSNIHRGVYQLSQKATDAYEGARKTVAEFINAEENEVVFTKGATEAINLVAQTYGRMNIEEGDEILLTEMEHHANIVPWQMLAASKQAIIKYIPLKDDGSLDLAQVDTLLTKKTKFVSLVYTSNTLGTINDVKQVIEAAHQIGAPVLIDACQTAAHQAIDVKQLDADFLVFSGHKLYGPTGIGVLYGKSTLLEAMPPYQGGGDMIESVTLEKTTFREAPAKFEAGTPNIAGAIGLGKAIEFIQTIGFESIHTHEQTLLEHATKELQMVDGLTVIGTASEKAAIISFIIKGVHPHDMGTILDQEGVAVRTGHHCTQPIMQRFKIPATTRASFAIYNTKEDVDALVNGIKKAQELLA